MTKGRPTIDGPHNRPSRICHTLNSFIGSCGSPTEGTWDVVYQRCPPLQTLVLRTPQHHNYAGLTRLQLDEVGRERQVQRQGVWRSGEPLKVNDA